MIFYYSKVSNKNYNIDDSKKQTYECCSIYGSKTSDSVKDVDSMYVFNLLVKLVKFIK